MSDIELDARRGRAIATQSHAGRCVRCWMPWCGPHSGDRDSVSVIYERTQGGAMGAFWLCRWCWDQLDPSGRVEWGRVSHHGQRAIWPALERAVLAAREAP